MILKGLNFIAIILLCSSCYLSREYPVEHDYRFVADFDKYESFSFVETNNQLDTTTNQLIKNTIKSYLQLLGYHYEPGSPKFLVTYFYINDSLKYNGYKQPEMTAFLKRKDKEKREKEEYKKQKFHIEDGTFVINFTDKEDYSMIWQGYTTDLYKDEIFQDPRKTRVAVISVLKNYAYYPELR